MFFETELDAGNQNEPAGQDDADMVALQSALQLNPLDVKAHRELATLLVRRKRTAQALPHLLEAVRLDPHDAQSHFDAADALAVCGRFAEAEAGFRECLRCDPDSVEAGVKLAGVLIERNQLDEAIDLCRRAIARRAEMVEAHLLLGTALVKQRKLPEAFEVLAKARQLEPDSFSVHHILGIAQTAVGDFVEAEKAFGRALELNPTYAVALHNLGLAAKMQQRFPEALDYFDRAIAERPTLSEVHFNRAALKLLHGELADGFAVAEWRLHGKTLSDFQPRWPVWGGIPRSGNAIVLCAEQGLGDTLHFVRYAPMMKQRWKRVIVECPAALHPLLHRTAGIDQLVTRTTPAVVADFCVPLMSLPHALGTTADTIPADIPYLFAEPQLVASWHDRIQSLEGFKVGIVWQGNPGMIADYLRSIPLAALEPLAQVAGVRLVNLQKGQGSEQLSQAADDWNVVDFGESIDTDHGPFMDTAAIMKNLDLVITSDTAAAHLAGGMGVNVWVALQYVPDWRWQLDRPDSPWYPTMRLFRQTAWFQWREVFERMAAELVPLAHETAARFR